MEIDQLVLWLAKLGFKKWESAAGPFVAPLEGDYYMVQEVDDVIGELTVFDVYFEDFGPYHDGSITFAFRDDEVISSQFWDDDLELTVDINSPITFESINDLKWHINHFKVLYQFSRSKSNAKN